MTHCHDLFYITVKYHDVMPSASGYGVDMKLHLEPSRINNSESMKARVVILLPDHCHELFYITLKYYDYITNGIQVAART